MPKKASAPAAARDDEKGDYHSTVQEKIAMLKMLDSGATLVAVADKFHKSTTAVFNVKKNRAKYEKAQTDDSNLERKSLREPKLGILDKALFDYYLAIHDSKVCFEFLVKSSFVHRRNSTSKVTFVAAGNQSY